MTGGQNHPIRHAHEASTWMARSETQNRPAGYKGVGYKVDWHVGMPRTT
jgi:hypothetical protein